MKLEINNKETVWVSESCGEFVCALKLPNGKYAAFSENDEGNRDFIENEEFETPEKAIDAARAMFS